MARLECWLLGPFRVTIDGVTISSFESVKVRALLAYLLAEAGRPQRRDALAELLWPDWPQQSAMRNLTYALADLRTNIGDRDADPAFLIISRESIQWNQESDSWLDVAEFEQLAARAQSSDSRSRQEVIDDLESAVGMYRGEFLESISIAESPAFEQWVRGRREGLERLALGGMNALAEAYEAQGELESALTYARHQVELSPWQEAGQQQLMRLLALNGQRSQALAQYEICRRVLADELNVELSVDTQRLYEAIRVEDLGAIRSWGRSEISLTPAPASLPPEPGEPPFKGLQYFDVSDADLFFGREELTARLVGHIREMVEASERHEQEGCCFLAVVGASGSGKSSVVRAGVVPALQRGESLVDGSLPPEGSPSWHKHVFTPTAHPLESLAVSLTRQVESVTAATILIDDMRRDERSLNLYARRLLAPAGPGLAGKCRLLLVVDQFEELFTLCRSEEERTAFLDNLMTAVRGGGPTQVIVVLRADFYGHCAQYPLLRQALCARQEYIGPMNASELRQAIEQPALRNGWDLEPGLVDLILRDVGAGVTTHEVQDYSPEPGALPLLEHALLETWKRRSGRTLTLAGYAEAGGVFRAIAHTAESVFARLNADQKDLARRIFLRLTELGEGTQDTRRRAALEELAVGDADREQVEALLKTLADARLITLAEDTAEVAHEALIREWPALRQWLSEDREGLRLHRHLTESAEAWQELEREPGELYRGARLAQAVEWAEAHPGELKALESEFLQASQQQAEREVFERDAQRQRELDAARRLVRTQRQRSLVLSVGLAIAVLLIGVAWWLNRAANTNLDLAEEQSQLSRSRELAAAAVTNLVQDPQLSLLLALEAYHTKDTSEAEAALHQAVQASHLEKILAGNLAGLEESSQLTRLAYSPDGSRLAALNDQDVLQVFNTLEGSLVYSYTLDEALAVLQATPSSWRSGVDLEFFPDGRLCLEGVSWFVILDGGTGQELYRGISAEGGARVVDRLTDQEVFSYPITLGEVHFPFFAEYTSMGIQLIVFRWNESSSYGELTAFELSTGRSVIAFRWEIAGESEYAVNQVEYSPDGTRMALKQEDHFAVWDLGTKQLVKQLPEAPAGTVASIAFSPDNSLLAVRSEENTIKVWQVDTGATLLNLTGTGFFFSPDGQKLIVSDANRQIKVWHIPTQRELYQLLCHPFQTASALRPDGLQLASGGLDGAVHLCEVSPDYELRAWVSDYPVVNYAYASIPSLLGIASADNIIHLYDAETGAPFSNLELASDSRPPQFDISEDGAWMVTSQEVAPGDSDIYFSVSTWETLTGREIARQSGLGSLYVDLSPDGNQLLAISGGVMAIEVSPYDLAYFSNLLWNDWTPVIAMRYSADAAHLALAKSAGQVSILDTATHTQVMTATLAGEPTALAFNSDGGRLAVATRQGEVFLLDAATGQAVLSLPKQVASVNALAYSPNGSLLATGSADGAVRLWDAQTGMEELMLIRHESAVNFLAFDRGGNRLVSGGEDGVARLSTLDIDEILVLAQGHVRRDFSEQERTRYHLTSQASPPDISIEPVPTGTPTRLIILPTLPEPTQVAPHLPRSPGAPLSADNVDQMVELGRGYVGTWQSNAVSPDGRYIVSYSMSLTLAKYELKTLKLVWQKKVDYEVPREISFSPNGSLIAVGGGDGNVHLLRAADGTELMVLAGHTQPIRMVKFSPDGKLLASCAHDDLIQLWSMPDGVLVGKLVNETYSLGIMSVVFSPDGSRLVSGSGDGEIHVWDVERQEMVLGYHATAFGADNVDISPDGSLIAHTDQSPGYYGVKVRQASDGRELYSVAGGVSFFSPDGSMLVTGDYVPDEKNQLLGIIRFYNPQNGALITSFLIRPLGWATTMFSPDSRFFYFTTWDGILHMWGVP